MALLTAFGPAYHRRPNGSVSEIRSTPRLTFSFVLVFFLQPLIVCAFYTQIWRMPKHILRQDKRERRGLPDTLRHSQDPGIRASGRGSLTETQRQTSPKKKEEMK
jgi:hypothetical protein